MSETEKVNILLVDDRPENLMALEASLEDLDLNIVKATSGNEALSLMLENDFALVLLDVQMPDMNGFETAEVMRESEGTKNIPIIFVTAISKDQKYVFKGYDTGAVDYLFKPLDPEILKSKAKVFINLHKQKKALENAALELKKAIENQKKVNKALQLEIIERKQAEGKLRESEEKYRAIFENIQDVYYEANLDGVILEVSPSIESISQYKRDELIGKSLYDLYTNPDERDELIKIILAKGKVSDFEVNLTDKDGSQNPCSVTVVLVRDEQENPLKLIGSMRDLRERKQAEQEKMKFEAQLQQSQKLESVGILAGGIAHDFNNLLAIIMGNISMTKDDVKPECGVTDFLNEAEKASLLAQNLTKQLITFSKGGAPVKKISYISNLIEKATYFALSGSNVGCEFIMPDDLWPVEIDEGQIRHVINNVVINAVQAMPQGGTIEVCTENFMINADKGSEMLSLQDGTYVKISFRDQGVGISDKDLPLIFDPYYSSKERGTQKGMGLGLATSYSIIKQHNGEITAESKLGVGTTINIYLPASEIKVPVKKKLEEKALTGKGKILVMDDEEMIRKMLSQMVSRLGYEAAFSKEGAETIEIYKKAKESGEPFDAVLLDLTVRGGMGGKDAIEKLIEIDPEVKAVVSSGHSDDPVMTDFRAYGFKGAMNKPFGKNELSKMLNKVIMEGNT